MLGGLTLQFRNGPQIPPPPRHERRLASGMPAVAAGRELVPHFLGCPVMTCSVTCPSARVASTNFGSINLHDRSAPEATGKLAAAHLNEWPNCAAHAGAIRVFVRCLCCGAVSLVDAFFAEIKLQSFIPGDFSFQRARTVAIAAILGKQQHQRLSGSREEASA